MVTTEEAVATTKEVVVTMVMEEKEKAAKVEVKKMPMVLVKFAFAKTMCNSLLQGKVKTLTHLRVPISMLY